MEILAPPFRLWSEKKIGFCLKFMLFWLKITSYCHNSPINYTLYIILILWFKGSYRILFEFLGKMITDHNPIFFRNTSIKIGSWSGSFFQESTKKGFYLLWLSFLIHNFSPDHAKIDLDHAQNDPDLLVGQIKYSQFLPQTIH